MNDEPCPVCPDALRWDRVAAAVNVLARLMGEMGSHRSATWGELLEALDAMNAPPEPVQSFVEGMK